MISAVELEDLETKLDWYPFLQTEYKKYQAYLHQAVAGKGSSEREILIISKQKKYVEAVFSELVQNAEVLFNFAKIVDEHIPDLERIPKEYLRVFKNPSLASETALFSSLSHVMNFLKDGNMGRNYLNKDTLSINEKLFVEGLNIFKNECLVNIEQLKARTVDSKGYFKKIQEKQEKSLGKINSLLEEHKVLLRTYREHGLIKAGTAVETQFVESELTKELYKWISNFKRQCNAMVTSSTKRGAEEIESIQTAISEIQTNYQNILRVNMDDWKAAKEQRFRRQANISSWIEKIEKDSKNNQNELENLRLQIKDLQRVNQDLNEKLNELDDEYLIAKKAFSREYNKFRENLLEKRLPILQRWWRDILQKKGGTLLQPIPAESAVKKGSKYGAKQGAKKGKKKEKTKKAKENRKILNLK